ncbi:MAG: hypothetical protein WBE58_03665 [Verrucomicrobiales bacterium]
MKSIAPLIIALLNLSLVGCSATNDEVGEIQEDLPGGGQAIIRYEVDDGQVVLIVQSFEATKYIAENRYIFESGKVSSIQSVISEIFYGDDFTIVGAREISARTWEVGNAGLALKKGRLNENPMGSDPDFLVEAKRLKELVARNRLSSTPNRDERKENTRQE